MRGRWLYRLRNSEKGAIAVKKVKVKMLESIAGLADPRPRNELDEKYRKKIEQMNRGRQKPFSDEFTNNMLKDMKERDRYGEKPLGFPRDWSFKPGDEPMIEQSLAEKWEDGGVCLIVREEKKAA
jgi:hypothetical protein